MTMPKALVVLSALLLASLCATSAASGAATDNTPVRILLAGDSLTQGSDGDFTWRYRLWRHLQGAGVDFVGPRDDVFDFASQSHGSQLYVDPAFDRDHAAVWGTAFLVPAYSVDDLMSRFTPDVVVQASGINDLVWLNRDPEAVVADAADFVQRARLLSPGVDVILVPLPHSWFPPVIRYNELLRTVARQLDTADSRVVTADTDQGFVRGIDTYDPFHFAGSGELRFAAAVADALAGLGIGTPAQRPLPTVFNGPRGVAQVTAKARARAALITWTDPPGASAQYLWVRNVTAGRAWHRRAVPLLAGRYVLHGLAPRHRYALRLQAAKGSAISELYSPTVWVVPRRPRPSPGTAAASSRTAPAAAPAPGR